MYDNFPIDWYIEKLEDVTVLVTDGSHFSPVHREQGYPLATVANMIEDNIDINSCYKISEFDYNKLVKGNNKVEKMDVLFSKDGTVGQCLVYTQNDELVVLSSIAILRPNLTKLNPFYLKYALTSESVLNKIIGSKTGTAIRRVILRDIRRIRIPVPPLVEQRGIVEVLGTVDECIRLTDAVIERAEELKRGLMQQLLTRGIGHTEYKETSLGEIPKTWKIVNLNDVSMRFISGGTPDTNNDQYWGGDIHWMKSAYIKGKIINCGEKFITLKGLKNSASNIIPKNNILIATRVSLGNVAVNNIDIAISQDLTGIVLNKNLIDKNFLYWLLFNSRNRILSLQQGTTIKGILRNDLEKLKILLPSLKEQRKISYILDLLDSNININFIKKEKLNMLKQGIMQILLSGKVRVELKGDGLHRIRCGRETHN